MPPSITTVTVCGSLTTVGNPLVQVFSLKTTLERLYSRKCSLASTSTDHTARTSSKRCSCDVIIKPLGRNESCQWCHGYCTCYLLQRWSGSSSLLVAVTVLFDRPTLSDGTVPITPLRRSRSSSGILSDYVISAVLFYTGLNGFEAWDINDQDQLHNDNYPAIYFAGASTATVLYVNAVHTMYTWRYNFIMLYYRFSGSH